MRHRRGLRKLNRATDNRMAVLRSGTAALFKRGKIRTTHAKAKEVRRMAEKMITLAKQGDLSARKRAIAILHDKGVVKDLFANIGQYEGRSGGCTRVVLAGVRRGDAAPMAVLELIAG